MIFNNNVFRLLVFLSLLILVLSNQIQTSQIVLLSHQWCRKCDKVITILQKIKSNLSSNTSFHPQSIQQNSSLRVQIFHHYHDFMNKQLMQKYEKYNYGQQSLHYDEDKVYYNSKPIYQKIQQKYQIQRTYVPFPTIWIQCKNYQGIYQNQINYEEIMYWIGVYCWDKIDYCVENEYVTENKRIKNLKREDYQFKINQQLFMSQKQQLIKYQMKYPFAKFCIQKKQQKINLPEFSFTKGKILDNYPLFFSKFDNNIRSYMFQSSDKQVSSINKQQTVNQSALKGKLGIFLIFNDITHPKIRQFIDIYKFISDRIHGNTKHHLNQGKLNFIYQNNKSHHLQSQYHQNNLKNYGFKNISELGSHLTFITACYNQNKRQCIFNYNYFIEENRYTKKDAAEKPIINKYEIPFSFKQTKVKNIKRIFQYTGLYNPFEREDQDEEDSLNEKKEFKQSMVKIIAVYFDKKSRSLKGYSYQDTQAVLGNQFLFWLQTIQRHVFKSGEYQFKQQKTQCLSSQLIHYMSNRNFQAIFNNIETIRYIDKFNNLLQQNNFSTQKINLKTISMQQSWNKIQSKYFQNLNNQWRSQRYKLCIKNQLPIDTNSLEQIKTILQRKFEAIINKTNKSKQVKDDQL